jgi:hypothetical protein
VLSSTAAGPWVEVLCLDVATEREQQALVAPAGRLVLADELEGSLRGTDGRAAAGRYGPSLCAAERRQCSRPSEQPSLAVACAQRKSLLAMCFGLDSLRQHHGSGPLGLGADGVHDLGDLARGVLLHERKVELDHLRCQERHECKGARVDSDVVERDAEAEPAQPFDGAEKVRRIRGQRSLGELDEHGETPARLLDQIAQRGRSGRRHEARLDVHEECGRGAEPGVERSLDGRPPALPFEVGEQSGALCLGEEQVGTLERRTLRTPGEGLVAHHASARELDDRLVDGAHSRPGDDLRDRGGCGLGGAPLARGARWGLVDGRHNPGIGHLEGGSVTANR